ncbi:YceI family protein [Kallotenue papyrolyticum]|uniref:YceI family protein n=1 Tax=Kallotenue papyrolyticum TaxID=1325125 RepID=UPI0004928161|nr:YceI family protein [Kallotenue papyrolyticum]
MLRIRFIVATLLTALVVGVALSAYSVFRAPQEASAPLQAIPLATETASAPSPTAPRATATASDATPTDASAATTATSTGDAAGATAAAPIIMRIVPAESQVRFVIDEVLNNVPKTVVGTTNQVAGEIAVDPADPTRSRVGVIQVNARTLTTDNEFRNRAIKNRILETDQYEFISFAPTQLLGLPQSAQIGQSYTFQIVGELTIRDVTREVTFDVTVTPVSATRLEGSAATTIRYADFGISIPRVPQVASVADEVRLEIDFVAAPA